MLLLHNALSASPMTAESFAAVIGDFECVYSCPITESYSIKLLRAPLSHGYGTSAITLSRCELAKELSHPEMTVRTLDIYPALYHGDRLIMISACEDRYEIYSEYFTYTDEDSHVTGEYKLWDSSTEVGFSEADTRVFYEWDICEVQFVFPAVMTDRYYDGDGNIEREYVRDTEITINTGVLGESAALSPLDSGSLFTELKNFSKELTEEENI